MKQPDIVIDKLGTHLFRVTRKNGTSYLGWYWDVLLAEVQAATSSTIDLVAATEAKLKKSRKKKVNDGV